ncbi:MAG: hypothetical protein AB8G95_21855 [Anaerolineae bacterium]
MLRSDLLQFIKNSEKMVLPGKVGPLFQRAEMLSKLPLKIQKFIIERGSKNDPFIGFVVEPYSFFLSYEITNVEEASKYLPPDYELIPCAMFDDGEPKLCAIIGVFNVHTSVFWGSRIELYVIAQNKRTGLLSWIIADYESNTISYDPGQGFAGSTIKHSVATTSYEGEVIIDIESAQSPNKIALTANLKSGVQTPLNQRLWVEGNLSVDYGGHLEDSSESKPFGLIFDPKEMQHALDIPLDEVVIDHNTFGDKMLAPQPFEALCFPFAQHFLTTSFPIVTSIKNEDDLVNAVKAFNAKLDF